jgi:hypothetical protein
MEAFAKPIEAVIADLAAQGHHADPSQKEVEQTVMRPPDVRFVALWASDGHSWQSPENLEESNRACTPRPHPLSGFLSAGLPRDIVSSLGWK